jgi:hypothetical protein
LKSKPTQSSNGSTFRKAAGADPAACSPTRKPSSRTCPAAASSPGWSVGSPPLKTTPSSSPRRFCNHASTADQVQRAADGHARMWSSRPGANSRPAGVELSSQSAVKLRTSSLMPFTPSAE